VEEKTPDGKARPVGLGRQAGQHKQQSHRRPQVQCGSRHSCSNPTQVTSSTAHIAPRELVPLPIIQGLAHMVAQRPSHFGGGRACRARVVAAVICNTVTAPLFEGRSRFQTTALMHYILLHSIHKEMTTRQPVTGSTKS
jgi:hypothetical protein